MFLSFVLLAAAKGGLLKDLMRKFDLKTVTISYIDDLSLSAFKAEGADSRDTCDVVEVRLGTDYD